jgi:hypothetical protein
MAINSHYIIEEISGTRCSVVEKKISPERASYIKSILESSNLEVVTATDESGNMTVGVTNLMFNLLTALYSRTLHTPERLLVTPAMWFQIEQTGAYYWECK